MTLRLVVYGNREVAKVVLAGRNGRFSARFPELRLPDCRGYVISATGSRGSRAQRRAYVSEPCGSDLAPGLPLAP